MWGLASAAALALMSRHVAPNEQGALQGANASIMGIASMIGPAIFTLSYAVAIKAETLPGAPFLLASVFLVAGLLVSLQVTRGE